MVYLRELNKKEEEERKKQQDEKKAEKERKEREEREKKEEQVQLMLFIDKWTSCYPGNKQVHVIL